MSLYDEGKGGLIYISTDGKDKDAKRQDGDEAERKAERRAPTILDKRLYIGNIDSSVAEYHIIKLFQPFGKITRIDYMWHKYGPHRGQPKGFCFLEYETHENAMNAIKSMDGKQVKGKHLVVSFSFDPVTNDSPAEGASVPRNTSNFNQHRGGGPVRSGGRSHEGHHGNGSHNKEQGELIVQPKLMTGSIDSRIAALEKRIRDLDSPPPDGAANRSGTAGSTTKVIIQQPQRRDGDGRGRGGYRGYGYGRGDRGRGRGYQPYGR
ncbi:RNA-binding domain-containing protein [Gonapodya prolifera JEL478]|uniref:Probable RNA-binding protein 18 n=1 Tax=Gonapodya prolifera (strain JEL478) TaxID=1344416 RepID=A0A139A9R9_GONPJ|nr:RNA-binding domain-containing protein [Gonapodya prolifera JEL478]|eukprot:KXS13582.1 RNA-binding domain-containing protein [Gonapodya prolifera JEL478]